MTTISARRLLAGASATALAASFAATIGVGAASADEISAEETASSTSSDYDVTRSISGDDVTEDGEVQEGAVVTVTNKLQRTSGGTLLYRIQDEHPECFEPVSNTSVWEPSTGGPYTNDEDSDDAEYVSDEVDTSESGKATLGDSSGWQPKPMTWSQDYTVDCEPGELDTGGVKFSTNLASPGGALNVDASSIGPTIDVQEADDDGDGDDDGNGDGDGDDGSDNGDGDDNGGDNGNGDDGSDNGDSDEDNGLTGSLGSLFGSLGSSDDDSDESGDENGTGSQISDGDAEDGSGSLIGAGVHGGSAVGSGEGGAGSSD